MSHCSPCCISALVAPGCDRSLGSLQSCQARPPESSSALSPPPSPSPGPLLLLQRPGPSCPLGRAQRWRWECFPEWQLQLRQRLLSVPSVATASPAPPAPQHAPRPHCSSPVSQFLCSGCPRWQEVSGASTPARWRVRVHSELGCSSSPLWPTCPAGQRAEHGRLPLLLHCTGSYAPPSPPSTCAPKARARQGLCPHWGGLTTLPPLLPQTPAPRLGALSTDLPGVPLPQRSPRLWP